jgi:hypothetical protein
MLSKILKVLIFLICVADEEGGSWGSGHGSTHIVLPTWGSATPTGPLAHLPGLTQVHILQLEGGWCLSSSRKKTVCFQGTLIPSFLVSP